MLAESLFSTLEAGAHEAARKVAGLLAFEGLNRGRAADERVRPFNFLLVCYPDRLLGLPPGADPTRFRLVAPYERDATKWIRMRWFEAHAGQVFPITTYGTGGGGSVLVKTYGEIVEEYRVHEETKSVGPDYHPCGKKTRGLLRRRRVKMRGKPRHIGKESNRLEERLAGIVTNEDDYLVKLGDDSSWSRLVIPAVRRLGFQAVRKKSGIAESTLADLISFRTRPQLRHEKRLKRAVHTLAGDWLQSMEEQQPYDPASRLAFFIHEYDAWPKQVQERYEWALEVLSDFKKTPGLVRRVAQEAGVSYRRIWKLRDPELQDRVTSAVTYTGLARLGE